MRNKYTSILLLITIVMFIFPTIVGAHAHLERSSPLQESELDESPTSIWLNFTEPIDTRVSLLRLENEEGNAIDAEQYSVDNLSLTLRVPPLEDGVYYVYWQVLSLDTHVTDGSFRFAVGVDLPTQRPEQTIVIGEGDSINKQDQTVFAGYHLLSMGFRIIDILMVMLIGGWLFFHGFSWTKEGDQWISLKNASRDLIERWMYLLVLLVFIGTGLGHIISRSIQLTQSTLSDPILWQTAGIILTSTTIGIVSLVRPVILAVLLGLTYTSKSRKVSKSLLVIGLTTTFGLTGHAIHTSMVFSHTIHMLALFVWLGGLIGFMVYSFLMKKQPESLHYMHKQLKLFSSLALGMVILVVITGALLSIIYLGSMNDLTNTEYGRILLWKLGIFSFIMVIAAFHRFVWLPNVLKVDSLQEKGKQMVYLFWGLRVELALALIVLIIAGMLSTASPPIDIHQHHQH